MTNLNPADEPLPEEIDPTPAEDTAEGDALAAANAKIAELEKKVAEIKDQALRALAEAENTRKRSERDRQDTAKFAVSSFARDLLTVADNLRRALSAISPEARENNAELKNIYTGVEMTERELLNMFERNNIRKVEPLGQKFDPNLHEVLFEADVPNQAPGIVVQVIEPGYTIHERLLRPARVGVAKGGETGSGGNIDQEV
ncbi:MAG TPA: nucleotide exchange factor GrpE [Patescibacteria group bacterium]|nr:nucleotide exchange factor GrpE [Patescibacteria group bacterium]